MLHTLSTPEPNYSLWLCPSQGKGFELQRLIDQLAKQFSSPTFLAHVTLCSPIKQQTQLAQAMFNSLAKELKPQMITPHQLIIGAHFYQSLYFSLQETVALKAMHKKAATHFNSPAKADYLSHISLVYKEPSQYDAHQACQLLSHKQPNPCLFNQLCLVNTLGDISSWKVDLTSTLNA
jgi:sulfur relay (sulfurtransferase) DsrC/TusE family protein